MVLNDINTIDNAIDNTIDTSIFQHGPVIVFRWRNAEGWPVELVTPNVGELLGYSADDFLQGRVGYSAQVHQEDLAWVAEEVRANAASGAMRFQHADYRVISKDGMVRWVEDHTRILRDAEGRATHFLGYILDVTARKAAEENLRRSEAEMRAMFDAVPDLLFKVDRDGVFRDYHAQNTADLAMPPEAFLGKRIIDVMPEPLGREGMSTLARALATGTVASHIYALPTMSGEVRHYEARYTPAGEGVLIVVRNITNRIRAEQALHQSEISYRHLADNLPAIVYRTTIGDCSERRTVFFNDMVTTLTGFTPDEIKLGSVCDCESFIHPDDQDAALESIGRALRECRPFEVEYRIVRKNGEIGYFLDRGRPVCDGEARPRYIDGVMFDITERVQAQVALQRFRAALDASADAIYLIDRERMSFVDANRVGWESLGYSRGELLQLGPHDIKPEFDRDSLAARFDAVMRGEDVVGKIETVHRRKDGGIFPVEIFVRYLRSGGRDMIVAMVRDVTERKSAEDSLIQAKLAAEEASRAKSEFLSRMSHELRTPLNAILGYSELMLDGGSDPISEDQRDCLGNVRDAGRHLLELINEVLDLAKVEAGKLPLAIDEVDWHDVVNQCFELTRNAAGKRNIELRDDSAEVAPRLVLADELRFKQALLNLLSNAVKYNREGGTVTLNAGLGAAGRLRIAVRDTGKGLTSEELGQLFQPFNRLSAEGSTTEGVGIGLVISKRLLELMGGAIGVESTPGEGSTFWLELPVAG